MNQIATNHPDVIALAKKAFPSYTGRKFYVVVETHPLNVKSFWDGGSRSYFRFVRIDGQAGSIEVPQQSAYDPQINGAEAVQLVPGLACVEHVYFCGKDMGLRIHVHPDNAPKLIPDKAELSEHEQIVLRYTSALKSSYGGISNYRYHEAHKSTGISLDDWSTAKQELINKKFLNRVGALTVDGRNQASQLKRIWSY